MNIPQPNGSFASRTVTIQIDNHTEERLRILAEQSGQSLEELLSGLAEAVVPQANGSTVPSTLPIWQRSPEERVAAFQTWVDSHTASSTVADDSRESIYAGRGE